MKSPTRVCLGVSALFTLAACAGLQATGDAVTAPNKNLPAQLRTEYATDPIGLDVLRPRLSWHLPASGDGRQSAYRVRVATSVEGLSSAPLWDSGSMASAASHQVAYGGPSLTSRTRYLWQVQTTDGAGRASGWSAPASWEMGLLQPEDWSASQWISGRTTVDHDWADATLRFDFTLRGAALNFLFRAKPVGKTYGEAYVWTVRVDNGLARLEQQVRKYAGGNSSKVSTVTLKSIALTDWKPGQHTLQIVTRGADIVTSLDGIELNTLNDASYGSGTIGFTATDPEAGTIHKVSVQAAGADFSADFKDGNNPFTGGDVTAEGLRIAAGVPDKDVVLPLSAPAPLLRRAFDLPAAPVSARLYAAGGGLPRLLVNGQQIGDALADGYTDYGKRVLYRSYDVTKLLKAGANVLAAELGRGWYGVTEPNEWYWHMAPWHAAPALRAQLEVQLANGQRVVIGSDGQWRSTDGPTLHDSVYAGERYDARLLPGGWAQAGFDDAKWSAANVVKGPAGALIAAAQEPIAKVGDIKPVAVTEPKPGVFVYDFGRIFAGRLKLAVNGARGTTLRLVQTEKLNKDGTVAVVSGLVDTQLQTDQYTLAGGGEERWMPAFSYKGFRYVQVEGYPGKPALEMLSAEIVRSSVAVNASFESSNTLLNRIQAAAVNTIGNNMHGNQTDTPTLEKNGWTGDAQASALASALNFDVSRVWSKWLADFRDSQSEKGEIPEIVPSTPYYGYENTPGWSAVWGPIPSWDAATFVLPWELYQLYGDRRILEQMYETQKKLVDYTGSFFSDSYNYANPNNFLLGEYASVMPPGGIIAALRAQANGPVDATAAAYYFHMLDLLARSAGMQGKSEDAARYAALAAKVREAYNARYWDAQTQTYRWLQNGQPKPYAQTPNILAVVFGLAPEGTAPAIMRKLNEDIVARGYHLGCGVYAGRYVMTLLADHGYADTAYQVATRTDFPSWGFWLENGLSTMAEGWELSSRSWDHHYWGSVSSYFLQSLAGIRPLAPGYEKAMIKPVLPAGLEWVRASVNTPYGVMASEWKLDAAGFTLKAVVPAGVDAEVWLPAKLKADLKGAAFVRMDGGSAVYRVMPGNYEFTISAR